MVETLIKNYYSFFDETIQSSTFIVLLISGIILIVGSLSPHAFANGELLGGNSLGAFNSHIKKQENIIEIDGVSYRFTLSKIDTGF